MNRFSILFVGFFIAVLTAVGLAATKPAKNPTVKCSSVGCLIIEDGQPRPLNVKSRDEMKAFKTVVKGCKERYGADYCPTRVYLNSSTDHVGVVCARIEGA